jgi:hypothetical protein
MRIAPGGELGIVSPTAIGTAFSVMSSRKLYAMN